MPFYRRRRSTTHKRGTGNRYKKPSKYAYKRKRFAKRRIAGSAGIMRSPNSIGFPQRMFHTFTYSGANQKLIQTVNDVPVYQQFRGNSMYDPDSSGLGSQPRWYDTYLGANGGSQPYRTCTVLGSKITVTIFQDPTLTGTSGSVAGVVFISPTAGGATTAPSSLKEVQERAFVRWRNVGNANSSKPLVLKHFAKTKALFQGVNPLMAPDDFQHPYNNNPASQWFWNVGIVNVIEGTGINLFSCWITTRIKYYCMMSTLNDVSDS